MPDDNKTEEFLKKLAPCIERGELEKCVKETARVAREMGAGGKLLELSCDGHLFIEQTFVLGDDSSMQQICTFEW